MMPAPAAPPMPPMQGPPPQPMPMPPMPMGPTYDIKIRRTVKEGRIDLMNIAPEYAIISRGSKDIETARISGYRCRKTISDLLAEGFSEEDLADLEPCDDYIGNSEEEIARWKDEDGYRAFNTTVDSQDRSRMEVWISVLFIRVDYDGDGKAELRMVTRAGESENGKILANVEVDENPMCSLTPIIMPHRHIGRSVADLVLEIQAIKTAILRQMMDNLYAINNQRHKVQRGAGVDLDALINSVPNGVVMMDRLDAVEPFEMQHLPPEAFKMLEYQDSVRETRTGVTRYNQGLDGDSLNKTARGISLIQGASQQRIELIARIFAETGVLKLFRTLLNLTIKHQDKERVVRLRGEWVKFDPRAWNADMDASIAVGLGSGSREAVMGQSMTLLQVQKDMAQVGIVTPENFYNNCVKIAEAAGHKNADAYFTDPKKIPKGPPKPSPEEMQAQMEQQKMQAQMQLEQQKMGFEQQKTAAQMQLEEKKAAAQINADMQKHAMSLQANQSMKTMEVESNARSKSEIAQMSAKPTTNVHVDAQGVMQEVADTLKAIAVTNAQAAQEQSQAFEQGIAMMAQASQTIAQAAAMMAAPKQVVRDGNGQIVGVKPA